MRSSYDSSYYPFPLTSSLSRSQLNSCIQPIHSVLAALLVSLRYDLFILRRTSNALGYRWKPESPLSSLMRLHVCRSWNIQSSPNSFFLHSVQSYFAANVDDFFCYLESKVLVEVTTFASSFRAYAYIHTQRQEHFPLEKYNEGRLITFQGFDEWSPLLILGVLWN